MTKKEYKRELYLEFLLHLREGNKVRLPVWKRFLGIFKLLLCLNCW